MTRFAILVASAFILRAALQARELETEIHLKLDIDKERAADPTAPFEPGGRSEVAADYDKESAVGALLAMESAPGALLGIESAPSAAACEFTSFQRDVLEVKLKASGRNKAITSQPLDKTVRCTSMNIPEDDECCELLKSLADEVEERMKAASNTQSEAAVSAWCALDSKDKVAARVEERDIFKGSQSAISLRAEGEKDTCKKHTDCAQDLWTNGMACAKKAGSSWAFGSQKCRLCPNSVLRSRMCDQVDLGRRQVCLRFKTCEEDRHCAVPSRCMANDDESITVDGRKAHFVCRKA